MDQQARRDGGSCSINSAERCLIQVDRFRIGYVQVTSSELAADASFQADYNDLASAIEAAGFTVTNTEDLATNGSVDRVLTVDLEPTLRAKSERKQKNETTHTDDPSGS